MPNKNWIKGTIKNPGALTASAKRVGKSLGEYCSGTNLSLTDKKRCVLRKTLMGFNKK